MIALTNNRPHSGPLPQGSVFLRFLRYELVSGILFSRGRLALSVLVIVLLCGGFMLSYSSLVGGLPELSGKKPLVDFAMVFGFLLTGSDFYSMDGSTPFVIPAVWILAQTAIAFLIGSRVNDTLEDQALQTLTRVQSRDTWWIAQCIWVFIMVAIFYIAAALFAVLLAFILTAQATPGIELDLWSYLTSSPRPEGGMFDFASLFIAPFLLSAALSMLQVSLSLVIGPIPAFLAILCYDIASVYLNLPFLIGDDAMIARSSFAHVGGYNPLLTMLIALLVFVASAILGRTLLLKKDLAGKKGE